ncbi:MAG: MerR family DNA-binding protein [Bacteroidota bacterium]
MLIGEVVKRTGFSRDTIRFYEKKGLLTVGRTDSEWNNYKDYDEQALRRLMLIKKCKGFGFTLSEIANMLELVDEEKATCKMVTAKLEDKLSEIDHKIEELIQLKKLIKEKFTSLEKVCGPNRKNKTNCVGLTKLNAV